MTPVKRVYAESEAPPVYAQIPADPTNPFVRKVVKETPGLSIQFDDADDRLRIFQNDEPVEEESMIIGRGDTFVAFAKGDPHSWAEGYVEAPLTMHEVREVVRAMLTKERSA